jgi:aconitate hydratase
VIDGLRDALAGSDALTVTTAGSHEQYLVRHQLSPRQVEMVLAGGQIPLLARAARPPETVSDDRR